MIESPEYENGLWGLRRTLEDQAWLVPSQVSLADSLSDLHHRESQIPAEGSALASS